MSVKPTKPQHQKVERTEQLHRPVFTRDFGEKVAAIFNHARFYIVHVSYYWLLAASHGFWRGFVAAQSPLMGNFHVSESNQNDSLWGSLREVCHVLCSHCMRCSTATAQQITVKSLAAFRKCLNVAIYWRILIVRVLKTGLVEEKPITRAFNNFLNIS